jgi:hypothetical protein
VSLYDEAILLVLGVVQVMSKSEGKLESA